MKHRLSLSAAILLVALVLASSALPARAAEAVPRARYVEYARASADWAYRHAADLVAQWKKSFDPLNVFGYRPPGGLLETAVI